MDVTGIILAGGKSSRMGEDKGLIPINGKSMISHIIDAMSSVVSNIIIISNNKEYEQFGLKVYPDIVKEKGPVGGIYTGLYHTNTDLNLCVSCDVPFITTSFLSWLLLQSKNNLVTVPFYKNRTHQLIGVYKKQALNVFKKSLDSNQLKLRLVNNELNCKIISVNEREAYFSEKIFDNINTRVELNNSTK